MDLANVHPIVANYNNDVILFNNKSKNYAYLSNYYESTMLIDGNTYYHVEGYFQSQKHQVCGDIAISKQIRNLASPLASKRISTIHRLHPSRLAPWTEDCQYSIMKRAILIKFSTHIELAKKLYDTGTAIIVENSLDEYWGCGKLNTGKNNMGKILMEIREIIASNILYL